ncbi:MAG TPA: Rieske 2Fe-2S domain-containing protein [Tepidisphaeraceae bacterium]|jgi:nitrite reductase/ring-hydroxylating ferredoxin subunit
MKTRINANEPGTKHDAAKPQWAEDFPIDVDQDNYVARRDFTKFMVLTSFAFVIGQLCICVENMIRRRRGKPPERAIALMNQVAVGSSISFAYPGDHDPCLLIRRGESDLVAYGQKCTHLSCAVVPKVALGQLQCPCHDGCFDMTSGRPISGPPRRPLPRITLEVRKGTIYATGVEERTV